MCGLRKQKLRQDLTFLIDRGALKDGREKTEAQVGYWGHVELDWANGVMKTQVI